MCGIVGLNFSSHKPFHKVVKTLSHRGPDCLGIYEYQGLMFGHTRLAIIDLDDEANQPMVFKDIIITFNGEIYNYKELTQSEFLVCETQSDTEVIIRLYEKYGTEFLHLLQGMFAFSIYDMKAKRYFCARDRFGKKPFYYYFKNGKFAYASEIKALLEMFPKQPELNIQALDSYLSYQSPIQDMTFFKDIHKLESGCCLVVHEKNIIVSRYYHLDRSIHQEPIELNEAQTLVSIEEHLYTALKRRLVGDEKVASFLSGGLDSSLISAMYSNISGQKIDTFSIGYDTHTKYSELPFAKKVAKYIDSNHHEIVMNKSDFIEHIDIMISVLDEPLGDSASIPTYILSKAVHDKGIKAALSGEGSDECFLGYDAYFKLLEVYNNISTPQDIKHMMKNQDLSSLHEYKKRYKLGFPVFGSSGETFMSEHKRLLYKNYSNENSLRTYYTEALRADQWLSFIDYKIWISEVLMTKVDRMSMANSLELRAPFLDHELIELSLSLPQELRVGNTNKYLLKKIATKYLPKEIVHREKKGFSSPFIEWLYEEYDTYILDIILEVNNQLGLWQTDFIYFLFKEAREGKYKQHLWSLFVFSKWFKKVYM